MNVSKGYMEEAKEDGCNNVQNERCMLLGDSRIGMCVSVMILKECMILFGVQLLSLMISWKCCKKYLFEFLFQIFHICF